MGNIPEGYVPLGLVGFTDQDTYDPGGIYMENDLVHVSNAIWKCKIDNTQGIAPAENANWTIFINSTTELEGITAVDTKGVLGKVGEVVVSQALIDAIAQKVMTDLVPYNKIVNNFLSTDIKTALSGPMGKKLKDDITSLNSDSTTAGISGTDLNDFKSSNKPRWGYGFNLLNCPFPTAAAVEYIPYDAFHGVQRVSPVQYVGLSGNYPTAKRVLENGVWSSWDIYDPSIKLSRFDINGGTDFDQVALFRNTDNSFALHFYKGGLWIGNIT